MFLIPLALSLGAFYLAYDVSSMPQSGTVSIMLYVMGIILMGFSLFIAKLQADIRHHDRMEHERLIKEEQEINELLDDTSEFLREFQMNQDQREGTQA